MQLKLFFKNFQSTILATFSRIQYYFRRWNIVAVTITLCVAEMLLRCSDYFSFKFSSSSLHLEFDYLISGTEPQQLR
jgi:hypothetical protein